jgi:hypothetical protein
VMIERTMYWRILGKLIFKVPLRMAGPFYMLPR